MTVRFSDAGRLHGLRTLVLENSRIRITVLPELGGKIWSIVSKPRDREMLWHHPRLPPRAARYGERFDDCFSGGWDDVFPNDYPVTIDDASYPDHGEVWSLPMAWQASGETGSERSIVLEHLGIAIPTRVRKTIRLRSDEANARVRYELINEGARPFDAQFKLHPALPLARGARLHLPAQRVIVDEEFAQSLAAGSFDWPNLVLANGELRDGGHLPNPDSGETCFLYGVDLTAGYCAVSYPDEQVAFGLSFDPAVMTSVWMFATFGGWRNLSTIILEPCTGHFAHLDQAIERGAVMTLEPGRPLVTEVVASVLGGGDEIEAFLARGGYR